MSGLSSFTFSKQPASMSHIILGTVAATVGTAALLLYRRVRSGWSAPGIPKRMKRAMVVKNVLPTKDVSVAGFQEAVQVIEVDMPVPGPGKVLVRMESSPINPSDLGNLTGRYNEENRGALPAPLGLEGSGTVVAAGPGLLSMRITGKRVACAAATGGAWSEYNIVDATQCAPIPDDVTFEEGCAVFVNPLTVMAMISMAQDKKLNTILHTAAASSLGKMLVRTGKRYNIRILCVVRREEQAQELYNLGVDKEDVFSTHEADWATKLTARCTATKCKLGFDAICGSTTGKLLGCLPHGASLYVYGNLAGEDASGITTKSLIEKDQTLAGLYLGNVFKKKGLLWAIRTLSSVMALLKTDLRTDVAKRFSLEQVPEAIHYYIHNMSAGKVVIRPRND